MVNHLNRKMNRKNTGFTLIEILVVLAIIATLLSLVSPRYFHSIDRSKETILKHDLATMRDAIDKFYSDKNAYPDTLGDLVQFHYLRAIPKDPITESASSWLIIPPEQIEVKGNVYDVKSGSKAISADGTAYSEW
jgi:general secretion pathway protein G